MNSRGIVDELLDGGFAIRLENVYKEGIQKLDTKDLPLMFRGTEAAAILGKTPLMKNNSLSILVHGKHGNGKSTLLKRLKEKHAWGNEWLKAAFLDSQSISSRSMFFSRLREDLLGSGNKMTIPETRERIEALKKKGWGLVLLIDDVDRLEYRTGKELEWLREKLDVSTICSSSSDVARLKIPWESRMFLPQYERNQMMDIIMKLVRYNVKRKHVKDEFPIDSCVNHVITHYESNINIALWILEKAFMNMRIEIASGREADYLLMTDVEKAIGNYIDEQAKPDISLDVKKDTTISIIMMIISIEKNVIFKDLVDGTTRSMVALFPTKKIPSESTIRKILKRLEQMKFVKSKKKSAGYVGVKTWWTYVPSPKHDMDKIASRLLKGSVKKILLTKNGTK